MTTKIDCLVCRGTGIYFNATNFGKNPVPCRYCKGTGKVDQPEYRFHIWAEPWYNKSAESKEP